jgi:hypothetical protein
VVKTLFINFFAGYTQIVTGRRDDGAAEG